MQPDQSQKGRRTSRLILLSVCIGQTIVGLDQRAITVALPTLTATFHTAFTTIQWTVLIYDLVLIGLIITMGRLGDLFGRRRFYSLGFLIDTIGWRWIFYIHMPFSLYGAYLAWKVIPETRTKEKIAVDIPGAILLLLTNGLFIYAIDQLPRVGWRHPIFLTTLSLSLVALIFLLRAEARAKTPILNLSMFHTRLFSAGILSLFLISATLSAINFLLPFFLQNLLGYSPSQVGWIIVADSLIIMFLAPVAGALSDRLGSRLLCTIGCAIIALAQFFLSTLDLHSSLLRIVFPLVLWGIGWALFNAPNQSSILNVVSPERIGAAAGMIATTARTGGAMGVALSATLFGYLLSSAGLNSGQIESPQSWRAASEIFIGAFSTTILVLNIFTLLAVFFSAVRGPRRDG